MSEKEIKDIEWVIEYAYSHDDYVNWEYVQYLKDKLKKASGN